MIVFQKVYHHILLLSNLVLKIDSLIKKKKKHNGMVELTLRQRPTSGLSSSAVAVDARLQLGCGGKIPIFQWIYEV